MENHARPQAAVARSPPRACGLEPSARGNPPGGWQARELHSKAWRSLAGAGSSRVYLLALRGRMSAFIKRVLITLAGLPAFLK